MASLLQACKSFEKLAVKTSLIENNDPILKQLSDIKEFEDRVEFAEKNFPLLGKGSARAVFKISDDLILKVAMNEKGKKQNEVEATLDLQLPCVASVVVADKDHNWLVAHFTETMTKKDFKKIVGIGFDNFMSALFYAYNNESDNWTNKPKNYDEIKQHPLFKCIGQLVVNQGILLGDCDKESSWGIKDGKVYLRDWGLNKSVYRSEYDSSSSSESSPPKTSS